MSDLSIFSTCKEFKGKARVHQRNAIRSWAHIVPRPDVAIYGSEPGVYDITQELGFRHTYRIPRVDGIPLLDKLFELAEAESKSDIMTYINADVMVIDGLVQAIERVAERFPDGFLIVCRRWDISLDEELTFTGNWKARIYELIEEHGELHSTCSSDIFAWPKPLWKLPAFVVGNPGWDNWQMWKAGDVGWPVVDVTPVVVTAHSQHGYGPNAAIAKAHRWWRDNPLAMRNASLMGRQHQYCFKHVQGDGNLWRLTEAGLDYVDEEEPPG